jgi:two-component system response regulator FixJ
MAEPNSGLIAVVDDDEGARDSMLFLLEAIGRPAKSFAAAADFLSAGPERFACLVLDQHMPSMSGLELVQRLRAANIAMPILLISGDLSPGIVERAEKLGIEYVLEKPMAFDDLSAFIAGVFD